jgi:nucleoporin SEH1
MDSFSVLKNAPGREIETSFCLTWCPSRFTGPQLAVGAMNESYIWRKKDGSDTWQKCEELFGHRGLVRDISWAPSMGRSYHLIATASKDGHVRIFKLTDPNKDPNYRPTTGTAMSDILISDEMSEERPKKKRYIVECIADFDDHHGEVWRVSWNVTGEN